MPEKTETREKLRVISYSVNERYDRVVVLNNGDVFMSRSKGVNGNSYNAWTKWDILEEIKKDTQ